MKGDLKIKTRTGYRIIPGYKVVVDRSTSHGEDADLYEVMPHDGRRIIDRDKIIDWEF